MALPEMVDSAAPRFGELLRVYRKQQGLSQRELAGILRVADSTISRVEAGNRRPPLVAQFYERLGQVFNEEGIGALLSTRDAPQLLDSPYHGPRDLGEQARAIVVSCGFTISFQILRVPADLNEKGVAEVSDVLKKDIESCARHLQLRRTAWDKIIGHR